MSKIHLVNALKIASSIVFVVVAWWIFALMKLVPSELFPSPPEVLLAGRELWDNGVLIEDLKASLMRSAVGFLIGATSGIFVGLLTARVHFFRMALNPFLTLCRPIPAIALVPLAIVWFGIGEKSKYIVISYTVFLSVWLNTHHGMESIPTAYIRASRSLGAKWLREFFQIVIPAAAPHVVVGLRIGAALAFVSLVAAEMTGAASGIGFRLQDARQYLRMDIMFVGLIQLALLGAALDFIFVYLSKRLVHWESV